MKKIIILLFLSVLMFSCKKDDGFSEEQDSIIIKLADNDDEFAQYNFGDRLFTNFIGRVIDEQGVPLNQVKISIGNDIVYTDHNGIFILNSASVFYKFAYIKASKTGYIDASRTLIPISEESNDVQITLLKKNIVGVVNSGEVSEVRLDNGAKVSFAGRFIDAIGNPYSGKVEVSVHYLEPNQKSTFEQMPGMLFGQRKDGSATAMETYGMLAVNLYSSSGEVLNISEDSPAKLFFPISTTTLNPKEIIPLWYFDEEVGYWKEQGLATKLAHEYIAEVTHFSWWNCDLPIEGINVCFDLKKEIELTDFYFEITNVVSGQLIFSGITNNVGKECGLFPKGAELSIDVYSDCDGQVIYSQSLGSFSNEAFVEIKIPSLSSEIKQSTFTGTANNCNGRPITNGYLYLYSSDDIDYQDIEVISITDGIINIPFTYCEAQTYNLVVFDADTKGFSEKIELNLLQKEMNLGSLNTCKGFVGGVFDGNVTLYSQEEVNQFGLFGYNEINGVLKILGGTEPQINSLRSLNNLTTVRGLQIEHTINLKKLEGLNNLTNILDGSLIIFNNAELENFKGLENITELKGDLRIDSNQRLMSLDGLNNILSIRNLDISGNASLQSLNKLERLSSLESLSINRNKELINLEGLNGITSTEWSVFIGWNESLRNLSGLDNLISAGGAIIIRDNKELENINSLSNLNSLKEQLAVINNDALISLSPLENARGNLTVLNISNNESLKNLDGLNNFAEQLIGIKISENNSLENIDGLINITSIDYSGIIIENNQNLANIEPLTNLITVNGAIVIRNNPMITKIGLKSLSSINSSFTCSNLSNLYNEMYPGSLIIQNNDAVTSLDFENLTIVKGFLSVSDNDSLVSLSGFDNLYDLAYAIPRFCQGYQMNYPSLSLEIKNNTQLEDFCALKKLFEMGHLLSNDKISIGLNKYNPTIASILSDNCKL